MIFAFAIELEMHPAMINTAQKGRPEGIDFHVLKLFSS